MLKSHGIFRHLTFFLFKKIKIKTINRKCMDLGAEVQGFKSVSFWFTQIVAPDFLFSEPSYSIPKVIECSEEELLSSMSRLPF